MGMLDSGRGTAVTVAGGLFALTAAGAVGGVTFAQRPAVAEVSPAPGTAVATSALPIVARLENAERFSDLRVLVDGRDVTTRVRGANDQLVIPSGKLADGAHTVDVRMSTDNPFARTVAKRWSFAVDTTPPEVGVVAPRPLVNRRSVTFTGRAEIGAEVRLRWPKGTTAATVNPGGSWAVTARLPEGPTTVRVTARDAAGNASVLNRKLVVDSTPPGLRLTAKLPPILRTEAPVLVGSLGSDAAQSVTFGGTINGRPIPPISGAGALPIAGPGTQLAAEALPGSPAIQASGNRFRLLLPGLSQGRNRVAVWSKDSAGNRSFARFTTLVDSTESFGTAPLEPGARGADVRQLQLRLKEARLFKKKPNGRFDEPTYRAVRAYQRKYKLRVTGAVTDGVLRKMIGRIRVDISQRRLQLIRNGQVVKTYRVAVGAPAYPTPTGKFTIIQKQKDPAWFPPNSPWAKGLGPIPPGPGNPLGTRWIGTSADAIGIHGTYAEYSIGSAASHGCIRMKIKDVEELYEQVALEMPVELVA